MDRRLQPEIRCRGKMAGEVRPAYQSLIDWMNIEGICLPYLWKTEYALANEVDTRAPVWGKRSIQCRADRRSREGGGQQHRHRGFCRRMFLGRRCRLQTCEGCLQSRFRIRGR